MDLPGSPARGSFLKKRPRSPACLKLGFSFKNRKPLPQTKEGFLIVLERSLYFSSAILFIEV